MKTNYTAKHTASITFSDGANLDHAFTTGQSGKLTLYFGASSSVGASVESLKFTLNNNEGVFGITVQGSEQAEQLALFFENLAIRIRNKFQESP